MKILRIIIPCILIVAILVFSHFSSLLILGESTMPFTNDYKIPNSIPEYQRITMAEKTDWSAKYIWDKENLTEENTLMCFVNTLQIATGILQIAWMDSQSNWCLFSTENHI